MFIQRKIIPGIVLCLFLFSAFIPILGGVQRIPVETFGGGSGTVVISQTERSIPLNESTADSIEGLPYVDLVSPEVFAFSVLNGEPVMVRGVRLASYLEIEDAELVGGSGEGEYAVIGRELSERLHLDVGDLITLTGSMVPAFMELEVGGIYSSGEPADDVLIPLSHARKLVGLSPGNLLTLRIETSDRETLIQYLRDQGYSFAVSWGDRPSESINENLTEEERIAHELALKYANTSQLSQVDESLTSIFVQRGSGSIGVVVLGFILLNGLLCFIGITSLFAKSIIEKQGTIGVLSAIGATRSRIQSFVLSEVLEASVLASAIGLAMGFMTAYLVGRYKLVVAFGQTVVPQITVQLALGTLLGAIAISCLAGLVVSASLLRERPAHLMERRSAEGEERGTELSELLEPRGPGGVEPEWEVQEQ